MLPKRKVIAISTADPLRFELFRLTLKAYEVVPIASETGVDPNVARTTTPDLLIVDLSGFGIQLAEAFRTTMPTLPLLFIHRPLRRLQRPESLMTGRVGFIETPAFPAVLADRVCELIGPPSASDDEAFCSGAHLG